MWGKLPFLAVLIGIFGVYSGNAFGDGDVKSCDSGWWWNGSFCQQCPTGFNKSKPNANKRQDCYFESEGTQKFYGTKTCSAGQYLPKDSASCTYCYSKGKWCPGGTYAIYQSYSQGMYSCPDDYPNTSFDGDKSTVDSCYNSTWIGDFHYNCSSGKWYNTITRRCNNECPTNYNKSEKNKSIRPEDCKSPSGAHYSKKCPAGKYLPKNKNIEDGCTTCPNDRVCPGGYFTSFIPYEDQGIFKCPIGYKKSGNTCVVDNNYNPPTTCGFGEYKTSDGCKPCPDGFKLVESNATSQEQCYARPEYNDNIKLYYKKVTCGAGKYLPKEHGYNSLESGASNGCEDCPMIDNKRWCPGTPVFPSLTSDQGYTPCPGNRVTNSDGTQCVTPEDPNNDGDDPTPGSCTITGADNHCCKSGQAFQGQGQYYSNNQCVNCPSGFKNIEQNKTSVDSCFRQGAGGARLYYKQVSCSAGQYLPAGRGWNGQSDGCTACPDDGKSYCPSAGTYWPDMSKNQGIKECSNNKVPNSTRTACQNSSGGENGGGDNIGSEFTCTAGFYLPAYGGGCQECTITTKYCPGGKYKVGTTDRGIFDCPTGGVATSDWKSCDIKLSKIKMKFGPNGTSTKLTDQCWLKTNIRDYAKCIFENSGSNNPYIHDNYKNEYEIETYNPNAPADS